MRENTIDQRRGYGEFPLSYFKWLNIGLPWTCSPRAKRSHSAKRLSRSRPIEQRIGRCHRYGQKHDVVVINFLNERNAADQRVLELLSE